MSRASAALLRMRPYISIGTLADGEAPMFQAAAALLFLAADPPADAAVFPQIETETLAGDEVAVPRGLPGPTLLLVGFERDHADALLGWVEGMGLKQPGAPPWRQFTVLGDRSGPVRWMIDNWMKVRIDEPDLRAKTLMVYRDREAMADRLGLPGTGAVAVFAVSPDGEILGRAVGPYEKAKAEALAQALAEEERDAAR